MAKQFEPTAQAIRNWVKAADAEALAGQGEGPADRVLQVLAPQLRGGGTMASGQSGLYPSSRIRTWLDKLSDER